MLVAVERLVKNVDDGDISSITAVDLSKAFDSVDHGVLLTKLEWYGVDVEWFRSDLSGRKQVVRGGKLTLPMTCGVPQGSIVGPCLFTLFINDLPGFITHGHLIQYADGTVHIDSASPDDSGLASLKRRLETTMFELKSWFTANSLKMNEKKTDFLLIGSKPNLKKSKDFRINIGESFIYASDSLKFLGVTLSSDLSWEAHISLIVNKCNAILVSLNRIRHYFTREALNTIIQAYVSPHVTYCLCVWGGAPKVLLHKVQKVINFSARVIVGGRKFDHITPVLKSLAWPSIEKLVGRRDALNPRLTGGGGGV